MGDRDILNQQCEDNKINYTMEYAFPVIKCQIHSDCLYQFINLKIGSEKTLLCMKCFLQNIKDGMITIQLDEIFSTEKAQIIENWPPLQDSVLKQQILSVDLDEKNEKDILTKVDSLFSTFNANVIKIIEDHKKTILPHLNKTIEQKNNILKIYNEICDRDQIKQQFMTNTKNPSQLEIYLKNLIISKGDKIQENEFILKKNLDIMTSDQQKVNYKYIETLSQEIQKKLKQIDFLNPFQTVQDQITSQIKNEGQQEVNNKNELLQKKVESIMSLVSNKTNFCNNIFLNNLKEILMNNKNIFSYLDMDNIFIEDHQPIQFESMQSKELDQLSEIIQLHAEENQNLLAINNNEHRMQELENNVAMNFLLKQFENRTQKEMNKFFTQKFDSLEEITQQIQYVQKGSLLQSINIFKSKYGAPDRLTYQRRDPNYIQIEQGGDREVGGQMIIDEQILLNYKYQITIELDTANNKNIMLGLLPLSKKDQQGWTDNITIFTSGLGFGITKVDKGNHLSAVQKDLKQITFQICLRSQILRCMSIVNNQVNINSLANWNSIKRKEEYYFYIYLSSGQKVGIKEFKRVLMFDEW